MYGLAQPLPNEAQPGNPGVGKLRHPMPMTPEQFDARIRDEIAANAVLVRAAGIRPE
jgi:hypothetical protein